MWVLHRSCKAVVPIETVTEQPIPRSGTATATRGAVPIWFLAFMLSVDGAFVFLDILHRNGLLDDTRFLLTTERGYGEIFQYFKFCALAAVLWVTAIRWRSIRSFGWVAFFVFLLIDDAWQIHERTGVMIADAGVVSGFGKLRPSDIGELLFFLVPAIVAVGLAFLVWTHGSRRERSLGTVVLTGVALVAVFGVGADVLHSLARRTPWQGVAAVIEDGGELLSTSLLLALVVGAIWPGPSKG